MVTGNSNLGMKADLDLMKADFLDWLRQVDVLAFDLDAGELADALDDVADCDRSVQATFVTCLSGKHHAGSGQARRQFLGVVTGLCARSRPDSQRPFPQPRRCRQWP